MLPVTLLTGFLGSGKTTVLARLLRDPALARTAVIINEFGEIGLDHELIAASDEQFVSLTTGCLCCKVQSDLVATLEDLLARRAAGRVMAFERVVIETSGLADPAPVLHALMTTPSLAERLALACVVTTVDAVTGLATLAREPVSATQAAVADRLIVTKTDLTGGSVPAELAECLDRLNPEADRVVAVAGSVDAELVLGREARFPLSPFSALERGEGWGEGQQPALAEQAVVPPPDQVSGANPLPVQNGERGLGGHLAGIGSFTIVRDAPIAAVALTLFLEALAEHCGADLLRLKGLVAITEAPERPAVVHGVQHVVHPLTWLERWPSDDRRSRLVFIVRRVPRGFVEALLAAIEAEVAETRTVA